MEEKPVKSSESYLPIIGIVLSSLFFIPFIPLFGVILGVIALIKCRKKTLGILAVVIGLLVITVQIIFFVSLAIEVYNIIEPDLPSKNLESLLVGQQLEYSGQTEKALRFYNDLLLNQGLNSEEKAILQLKIDKIQGKKRIVPSLDLDGYTKDLTIKIIPVKGVALTTIESMCPLIKSKFGLNCKVLESINLDESSYHSIRNQYHADEIVESLYQYREKDTLIIAVTNKDIYTGELNFVFALQDPSMDVGVISTYRFENTLPQISEWDQLLVRRLGIQFLSTVGILLEFDRPADPTCPLAYPGSTHGFLHKSSKFCKETKQSVDRMLAGKKLTQFSSSEKTEMMEIYQTYYFE